MPEYTLDSKHEDQFFCFYSFALLTNDLSNKAE